ncbi:MAG: hypothetical protein UW04_C0028G0004 [Parcubacteria group bacterium GW2011_GWB1_43_8]|nr:MAG: hypothetical protein UW04_C0028G0004 [Parcubacteria group bacterium GW2011_GWB1_43_8]
MKMFKKNSKGFTLIELLVVIAIIGILSSVVLASLNSARKKSRDARRVADVKQIQLALELYFDSNRQYPATVAALVAGGQIPLEPKDPISKASYSYAGLDTDSAAATCESYHLAATLEESSNAALPGAEATAGTACTGSAADFDGTVALVYDVKP